MSQATANQTEEAKMEVLLKEELALKEEGTPECQFLGLQKAKEARKYHLTSIFKEGIQMQQRSSFTTNLQSSQLAEISLLCRDLQLPRKAECILLG